MSGVVKRCDGKSAAVTSLIMSSVILHSAMLPSREPDTTNWETRCLKSFRQKDALSQERKRTRFLTKRCVFT
jgi:hypothetical protein